MIRRTNKLHLIKVKHRTVAIIPAKNESEAIEKYVSTMGFDTTSTYFRYLQMSSTASIDDEVNCYYHLIVTTNTETIGDESLSIVSQRVTRCNDIVLPVDRKDINSPLFIRPTIEEARGCLGFDNDPESELRKFCR